LHDGVDTILVSTDERHRPIRDHSSDELALTFDDATSRRQRIATGAVGGRTSRDGSVRSASSGAKTGALIDR
jgi:hypothetical protein